MAGPTAALAVSKAQKPAASPSAGAKTTAPKDREPSRRLASAMPVHPASIPADPPQPGITAWPLCPTAAPLRGFLQPKLAIGAVDDPLEREADAVADRVMRMPDPTPLSATSALRINRKCAECEREDEVKQLRMKSADAAPLQISRKCAECEREDKEKKKLQMKSAGAAPPIVHEVLRSPGQPLDAKTRAFMESRFGYDFGNVYIHTGNDAHAAATSVHARAFTVGRDVVFAAGEHDPRSESGRRLLAHELTHVVQHGGTNPRTPIADADRGSYRPPERQALNGNISNKTLLPNAPCAFTAGGTAPPQTVASSGAVHIQRSGAIISRSESIHPEEQHCDDISKDSAAPCSAIMDCINEIIEALAGRFADYRGDPGHLQRIRIVQRILKALMVLARFNCKNGEYDKETEEETTKWSDKDPAQKDQPVTEEQKRTLRERLPTVPEWVWLTIGAVAAALIIACFASGACEVGAIITALGEGIGWIIVSAMRLAGVGLLAQAAEAAPSTKGGGTSAVA